ncbi:MAG: matrixin family metalloprotease [Verrucomicrobiota bacterium]
MKTNILRAIIKLTHLIHIIPGWFGLKKPAAASGAKAPVTDPLPRLDAYTPEPAGWNLPVDWSPGLGWTKPVLPKVQMGGAPGIPLQVVAGPSMLRKATALAFFVAVTSLLAGSIQAQSVTVTAPNGGQTWTAGSTYTVTWAIGGSTANINYQLVALSTDGGSTFQNISAALTPGARSFNWTIPGGTSSTQARIRVRALDVNTFVLAQDASDSSFTISGPVVNPTATVNLPNGGQIWTAGNNYNVTWGIAGNTANINYQLVALSTDGGSTYNNISAALTPGARSFSWTIPDGTSSTQARIRVRALDVNANILAADTSDANFTISAPVVNPTVTVTVPNGGQTWTAGNTHNATWTISGNTANINYQLVALSTDGGSTYNNISAALTPGARSFSWAIPGGTSSTQARIRVRALDVNANILAADTSDANFTISPGNPIIRIAPLNLTFDSLSSSTAPGPATNDSAAISSPVARYELKLRNRRFTPDVNTSVMHGATNNYLLIQFTNSLTAESIHGLRQAGVNIVNYVSDYTLIGNVPAGSDLTGVAGVRWAGELFPADKISPLVKRVSEKQKLVVKMFAGVDAAHAHQLLSGAGCEVITNRFLRPETHVVRADYATVEKLAALNQVAWMFPASDALTSGQQLHECPGQLTPLGPVADFVTQGEGWDGPGKGASALSYFFENGTTDIAGDYEQSEVERGLREWSKYAAITFTRANSAGLANSIDISWLSEADHGDGFPFAPTTLAHAFYPPPIVSNPRAGDIHFNDAFQFSIGSGYDIFSLTTHEAGHSLGLNHSDNPAATMYAFYQYTTGLHDDDIQGIRSLYASADAATDSFTIYNDGLGGLTVTSISPETSAPWITWSPQAPFSIAAGASQVIRVSVDFGQSPSGQSTRRLRVFSNDTSNSPVAGGVNIVVNSPAPAISVTPASRDFGSLMAGTTASRTFTVQNTGRYRCPAVRVFRLPSASLMAAPTA